MKLNLKQPTSNKKLYLFMLILFVVVSLSFFIYVTDSYSFLIYKLAILIMASGSNFKFDSILCVTNDYEVGICQNTSFEK